MANLEGKANAVFNVGSGRGFLVGEYIITATHCLETLPEAGTFPEELFCPHLVGRIGSEKRVSVLAVCLDPISDIAVLGASLDHYDDWCHLTAGVEPFELDWPSTDLKQARVLSLARPQWLTFQAHAKSYALGIALTNGEKNKIACGMSGSPIVLPNGKVGGLVSTGDFNPAILPNLTPWTMHQMRIPHEFPLPALNQSLFEDHAA